MKQLKTVLEVECEGCIYEFKDGFMVLVYGLDGDKLYYTKNLQQAKAKLGVFEEKYVAKSKDILEVHEGDKLIDLLTKYPDMKNVWCKLQDRCNELGLKIVGDHIEEA